MTGVEILASTEVVTKWAFNSEACWLAIFIAAFISLFVGIFAAVAADDGVCGIVMGTMVFILGVFMAWCIGDSEALPAEYETHYTVTISEEVSYNEFVEKYEVVDQHGKLFTIKEK